MIRIMFIMRTLKERSTDIVFLDNVFSGPIHILHNFVKKSKLCINVTEWT